MIQIGEQIETSGEIIIPVSYEAKICPICGQVKTIKAVNKTKLKVICWCELYGEEK